MQASTTLATKLTAKAGVRRKAAIDIGLVVGTLLIIKYTLLSIEPLWTYAGPISLLSALAVASWRLRAGGEDWAGLGLRRPRSWWKLIAWVLLALVLTTAAGIVVESIANSALGDAASQAMRSNAGRFANVPGNPAAFVYWLAVAWIIGGFTEEMLFRAFLIRRLETLFARLPLGLAFAVILPAILFGQQHYYYQGISGALATGAVALVSGLLYLLFKRNLWPLTLSHGLVNTVGLTLIYTGVQPAG